MIAVLLLTMIAATGVGVGAWALADRVVARWECTHRGHKLELQARQNTLRLYVDGRLVSRKTTLAEAGGSIRWPLKVEGQSPLLRATVTYAEGGAPVGQLFADEVWIGGVAGVLAPSPAGREPTDERWSAAKVLLGELQATGDPTHAEAAARLWTALADALRSLDRLASASDAHRALETGAQGAAVERRLGDAREAVEGRAVQLLDVLRELHLLAVEQGKAASMERIQELVAQAASEAEVQEALVRRLRGREGGREGG